MTTAFIGNCVRVYHNDCLRCVFGSQYLADNYIQLMLERFQYLSKDQFRTELAFIEGIGF